MKQTIIFSFIVFNFTNNLFSQTDFDRDQPKIKMIEEALIGVVDQDAKTEYGIFKTDTTYLSRTDKRVFNHKGKLIEWQSSNYLLMTEQLHKYKLNKNGDWESAEIFKSDGEINNMIYEYNSKNNLISIKTYFNGELIKTQENTFDNNGNITKTELNEFNKKLKFKILSSYNEKNRLVERIIYDANSRIKEKRKFLYDIYGVEIENIVNYDDKNVRIIFEYDKRGNIIKQTHYDLNGKQIKEVVFEYDYDNCDNWLVKKRKNDKILSLIWERKIEYYE